MVSNAQNPLSKHFRQPKIYIKLPSGGKFYPEDSLEIGVSGEVPIYPMTVKDELLLKTPDALMNGNSIAEMIKSCCPSIKDPWSMPLVDLDPVLIAIRLASYGEGMSMTSTCTHCQHSNEHEIDLRRVLDNLKPIADYEKKNVINGLTFRVQPQTFKEINLANTIAFEQQKIVAVVENSTLSAEEKLKQFEESFKRLTELNINTLVNCIKTITTEEGEVVADRNMIMDFLEHIDKTTYDNIQELVSSIVKANALEPMEVTCEECEQSYKIVLDFNQANFFA